MALNLARATGLKPTPSAVATSRASAGRTRVAPSRGLRVAERGQRRQLTVHAATEEQQMRAAQEKWQDNIRQGRVRNVMSKDIKDLVADGWTILDVRPVEETEVVSIKDAVAVPLFEVDDGIDPGSLLKQMSAFGMGGWWLGGSHMKPNQQFMSQVQAKIPKDAKVLVTCQKGLRSLAACEQLSKAGYQQLGWINGGLDTVKMGDVETVQEKDLRYAGIGGLSSLLGWTEVQQEAKKGIVPEDILKVAAGLVALDLLVFAYEQVQYMQSQQ